MTEPRPDPPESTAAPQTFDQTHRDYVKARAEGKRGDAVPERSRQYAVTVRKHLHETHQDRTSATQGMLEEKRALVVGKTGRLWESVGSADAATFVQWVDAARNGRGEADALPSLIRAYLRLHFPRPKDFNREELGVALKDPQIGPVTGTALRKYIDEWRATSDPKFLHLKSLLARMAEPKYSILEEVNGPLSTTRYRLTD